MMSIIDKISNKSLEYERILEEIINDTIENIEPLLERSFPILPTTDHVCEMFDDLSLFDADSLRTKQLTRVLRYHGKSRGKEVIYWNDCIEESGMFKPENDEIEFLKSLVGTNVEDFEEEYEYVLTNTSAKLYNKVTYYNDAYVKQVLKDELERRRKIRVAKEHLYYILKKKKYERKIEEKIKAYKRKIEEKIKAYKQSIASCEEAIHAIESKL